MESKITQYTNFRYKPIKVSKVFVTEELGTKVSDQSISLSGRNAGMQGILTQELLVLQYWFSVNGLFMNKYKLSLLN